tara:strand:- start:2211 stop:4274 length:2064 start_codon:yes stop_codon:yes gene_type:complete
MALTKAHGHILADDLALGGNPTTSTQSTGNNTTRLATTAFVQTELSALVDSSPSTLNTLNELAAALGDDANFSTTVTNSIATKLPLAGGTMTGDLVLKSDGGDDVINVVHSGNTAKLVSIGQSSDNSGNGVIQLKRNNGVLHSQIHSHGSTYFNGGNVGIGFASGTPDGNLHVADGTAQITIEGTSSDATLKLESTGNNYWNIFNDQSDARKLKFEDNGNGVALTIQRDGNVGIGETSPNGPLHITSATPIIIFDESDASQEYRIGSYGGTFALYDETDSAFRFAVDGSGNVGIGTSSPTQKLDVNGTVELNNLTIAGSQGSDGEVLTSTGSGIAWEASSGGLPLSGGTLTGDTSIIKSGNPVFMVKTTGAGNNPVLRLQADTNKWDLQGTFSNTNDELFFMYNSSTKLAINKNGRITTGGATTFNAGITSATDIRATGASGANDANSITMSQETIGGSSGGYITARGSGGSTRGTIGFSVNEDGGGNGIIAMKIANTGKIGIGTDATNLSTLSVGPTTAHAQNRIAIFTDDYNYGCMRIGSNTAEASLGFMRNTTEANTHASSPSGGNNTWGMGLGVWGANFGFGSHSLQTYCVEWDSSGHMLPGANNTYDLGSTAKGWRNVYTNDLHLSNMAPPGEDMEGNAYTRDGNEVDGTNGSWTIQEGADDLYLLNRLNGKKYKFNLTEIS